MKKIIATAILLVFSSSVAMAEKEGKKNRKVASKDYKTVCSDASGDLRIFSPSAGLKEEEILKINFKKSNLESTVKARKKYETGINESEGYAVYDVTVNIGQGALETTYVICNEHL